MLRGDIEQGWFQVGVIFLGVILGRGDFGQGWFRAGVILVRGDFGRGDFGGVILEGWLCQGWFQVWIGTTTKYCIGCIKDPRVASMTENFLQMLRVLLKWG